MSSGTLRVSLRRARKLRSKGLTGKISPYAVFEVLDGADGATRETSYVPDCGRECSWNQGERALHAHLGAWPVASLSPVLLARTLGCLQSLRSSATGRRRRLCSLCGVKTRSFKVFS
jgi:hypothetical protein